MINQRLPSQHGEAMLRDTGLLKFWTVPDPSMINGFKALLEPAYILGDRKHIPEAQNAVPPHLAA